MYSLLNFVWFASYHECLSIAKADEKLTVTQHLLNDPHDPFNRKDLSIDMVEPADDLRERMAAWLSQKRAERDSNNMAMEE